MTAVDVRQPDRPQGILSGAENMSVPCRDAGHGPLSDQDRARIVARMMALEPCCDVPGSAEAAEMERLLDLIDADNAAHDEPVVIPAHALMAMLMHEHDLSPSEMDHILEDPGATMRIAHQGLTHHHIDILHRRFHVPVDLCARTTPSPGQIPCIPG